MEKQRGSIQDCRELHLSTLDSLKRSLSGVRDSPTSSRKLGNARAYLSAAMTNKNTCLEGLDSATGSLKPLLVDSTIEAYKHVSNSLSMLPQPGKHVELSAPSTSNFGGPGLIFLKVFGLLIKLNY